MAKIALVIGTTMGGAEAVADELQTELEQYGYQILATLDPDLSHLQDCPLWLIVTSTHGAGELPANLDRFYQQIQQCDLDLSTVLIALCGIGDSSYDTFCGAIDRLDQPLQERGAKPIVDKILIDVQALEAPEDQALAWLSTWLDRIEL